MILFFKSGGELIRKSPERFFQGSNKANTIYFCCPTAENNIVNVAFSLPDGNSTAQHVLYPLTGGISVPEVFDENENSFKVWKADVPKAVTACCGKVLMQFYITASDQTFATEAVSFMVERGVEPKDMPVEGDSYQQLLDYFLSFRAQIENERENFENSILGNAEALSKKVDETINFINSEYSSTIKDNVYKVNMLLDLSENQKLISSANIVSDFTFRNTADGLNVVDASPATVQKISGETIKSVNLLKLTGRTAQAPNNNTADSLLKYLSESNYILGLHASVNISRASYIDNYEILENEITVTSINFGYGLAFPIRCNQGASYCLTFEAQKGTVSVGYYDENGCFISGGNVTSGTSFNSPSNANWLVICLYSNRDTANETFYTAKFNNIMLSVGSVVQSYVSPFLGLKNAGFEKIISTGRNLIDVPEQTISITDGYYKDYWIPNFIVKPNTTYTLSYDYSVVSNTANITGLVELQVRNSVGGIVSGAFTTSQNDLANGKAFITFTTGKIMAGDDRLTIRFVRLDSQGDLEAIASNIMLNLGNTVLPYEPYTESVLGLTASQELGKWDYINPQTGELIIATKTITFDGTEDWETNTANGKPYFSLVIPENTADESAICNIYSTTRSMSADHDSVYPYYVDNGTTSPYSAVIVNNALSEKFNDVGAWKAHLAFLASVGNPLTIAYKLRTPEITSVIIDKSFVAYNDGSEEIIQGNIDNSKFGAKLRTEIDYFVEGDNGQ